MTQQEHELMILMFTRTAQMFRILTEVLTSRGVLTSDDAKAFAHAIHYDDEKTLHLVIQTWGDYQKSAILSGVTTGLEGGLPSSPKA